MRYTSLIILIAPILCFCQASNSTEAISIQDLKIGKSQAGIMAELSDVEQIGNDWHMTMKVEKSRQGGAASPVIPIGRSVTGRLSELTLRKLDELRSTSLASDLSKKKVCLAVLGSKDKQTDIYEIYDLILIDK